jgi:hypothetical protein
MLIPAKMLILARTAAKTLALAKTQTPAKTIPRMPTTMVWRADQLARNAECPEDCN